MYDDFNIKQKFKSKKNDVFLIQHTSNSANLYILKKYADLNGLKKEKKILSFLNEKKINAPQIIDSGLDYILMEYFHGNTLQAVFEEGERRNNSIEQFSFLLQRFSASLIALYQALKTINGQQLILRDANLRNFLWANGTVFFIDFEEVCLGSIEEDISKICAYLLTYTPPFTSWKRLMAKEIVDHFSRALDLDKELLLKETSKELIAIKGRRKNITISEDLIKIYY